MEGNITKIYRLVKGQCSHPLRTVLNFRENYRDQDVLWFLDKLKGMTSELDSKIKNRCNLFNALSVFINMRQEEQESDIAYINMFKINLDYRLEGNVYCTVPKYQMWWIRTT